MNQLMTLPSPNEIMIMEYAGYKFRHGMYMRPLKKDLPIYQLLNDMEKIQDGRVKLWVGNIFKRRDYMYKSIRILFLEDIGRYCIQVGVYDYETGYHLNASDIHFHIV